MSATVNINIKGVAMCYQKQVNGSWRVLFPFDDCHSIKLLSEKGGTTEFLGHFGQSNSTLEVIAESATSEAGFKDDFNDFVFDLTSDDTHKEIRMKDGWEKKGALLTIDNVVFEVDTFVSQVSGAEFFDLFLKGGDSKKPIDELAHAIKGTIQLGEKGRVVVKTGATEIFATSPGETCTLTFDNHCSHDDNSNKNNDMEMFYNLIEDSKQTERKYLVEGEPKKDVEVPVTGFGFTGGKPCLVVKATSTDNLK